MTEGSGRVKALRLARRVAPASLRKVARRVGGRGYLAAQRAAAAPELTVVVPVYNVAEYLPEALDSALNQTLRNLEVIAVDDGSTDACPRILEEYAARDPRVRIFRQTNSGQGVARNLGVRYARGEFLTFLDADDTVPPQAYEHMISTLRRTGSDFAVGSVRRFRHNVYFKTVWARAVHQADRLGTTIDAFPNAMQDIIACNRMFRTRFWVEKVGEFRGHIAYEDHVPMLAAYVRAGKFDVLSKVTYNWRMREDLSSTGQQKADLENLLDRIAVKEEAHQLLRAEASDFVYDLWVARAIEVDFPAFIPHAVGAGEMYRNVLSAVYRTFFERATETALGQVRAYQKIRGWLIARSRWDDLVAAQDYFRSVSELPPTRAEQGRVVASIPEDSAFLDGMPPEVRELSAVETHFEGVLEHVRWLDGSRVELTGWALIRGLAMADRFPETRAWLANTTTGARVGLAVEHQLLPQASIWAGHRNAAYDAAGFVVEVDTDRLVAESAGAPATWRLHLEVEYDGVRRSGTAHNKVNGSSAANPESRVTELADGPAKIVPLFHPAHGFCLQLLPAQAAAERLEVRGRRATGLLRLVDESIGRPQAVRLLDGKTRQGLSGRVRPDGEGRYAFELDLGATRAPAKSGGGGEWDVEVVLQDDTVVPLAWPVDAPPTMGAHARGALAWRCGPRANARLVADTPLLEVDGVEVHHDAVELTVRHAGLEETELAAAVLAGNRTSLRLLSQEPVGEGAHRLRFSKLAPDFRGRERVAPPGNYWLSVPLADGRLVGRCTTAYRATLSIRMYDSQLNLRAWVTSDDEFRAEVTAPLPVDVVGPTNQARLQTAYRNSDVTPRDAVLFQCSRGELAAGSQLALDDGLRTARPELTRYWGVHDLSVAVPEGSVPVLVGSPEWYDVLASARYLCTDTDFDPFFRKRPHQRYLQTFDGHPFAAMGIGFWRSRGLPGDQIAFEVARRNRAWDAILAPTEAAAELYRREYAYDGEVMVTGYPGSDLVVDANRDAVRAEVLDRLGVAPDKTVVLYAPAYRDKSRTRSYGAPVLDDLDLDELTGRLGDGFVVLLREDDHKQRNPGRVDGLPQVVDVTDHPQVDELMVTADAAILDYSSLRFDWALTRRPAVFFVPDVEEYFASRPPLFDYEGTAPGPWLRTTAQVADALRDLSGVQRDFAERIEEFNRRFNPLHDGHATKRVIEAFFA